MYVGLPRRPGAGAIRQAAAHPAPGSRVRSGVARSLRSSRPPSPCLHGKIALREPLASMASFKGPYGSSHIRESAHLWLPRVRLYARTPCCGPVRIREGRAPRRALTRDALSAPLLWQLLPLPRSTGEFARPLSLSRMSLPVIVRKLDTVTALPQLTESSFYSRGLGLSSNTPQIPNLGTGNSPADRFVPDQ